MNFAIGSEVGVYSEEPRHAYDQDGPLNNPKYKVEADILSNKLRTYLSERKALFFAGVAAIVAFLSFLVALF